MTALQEVEVKEVVLEALREYNRNFYTRPNVVDIVAQAFKKIKKIVEEND